MILVQLLALGADAGASVPACAGILGPGSRKYGQEYSTDLFWRGIVADFNTNNPGVSFTDGEVSDSHLVLANGYHGATWVEDGWYQGEGCCGSGFVNSTVPVYYRAYHDLLGYHQGTDGFEGPTIGTDNRYAIVFQGVDPVTELYIWGFTWGPDFPTIIHTNEVSGLRGVTSPIAGGEVTNVSPPTNMGAHGLPTIKLKDENNNWFEWTPSYGSLHHTHNCVDSPYSYTQIDQWEEFVAT